MRKLLASFALVAVTAAGPVAAQSTFGVVGGFASSNITISGGGISASFNSRTGFAVGVSMAHPINSDFEFAPELLYIQKGTKIVDGSSSAGLKLGYVELPLLFRAKFGSGETRPFVLAGPAIGLKASCSVKGSDGSTSVSTDCGSEIDIKSSDFGVMFGAGVAHQRFSASVRYDLGLSNIAKNTSSGESAKNRTILALIGVSF
ncbi:MAG: porin family protein [Gemmatimonadota bacterium]